MASSRRETLWKRILRPDMKGQDVEALQRRLAELRYYTGECDGVYGLLTKGAVFDFQKAHRLRVDGIAGKEVFNLLRSGFGRERIEHIVAKDETLSGIGGKYKVPQELLITANSLETEEVEEGDSLIIPVLHLFGFCSPPVPGDPVVSYEYVLPFLTAIAPRWFLIDEHGDIQGAHDKKLAALAQMADVELWPVVSVRGPGPHENGVEIQDPLDNLLSDSSAYSKAVKGLSDLAARMRTKGFILSVGSIPQKNAYAFQAFLRKIRNAVKQEGLMLAVELPLPEETVSCQGQNDRKRIQDLEGIASVAHLVFLRVHKDPWEFTFPEPIVSIGRVRTTLKSLTRAVDFWKMIVVMPAFGVDFSSGLGTIPLRKRHREIMEIMELFKPTVSQPDGEKSKVFRYRSFRVSHTVYFEDAESIGAYVELAQRYGVAGIAIADLDDVDPWVWSTLRAKFKVVKDGGGDRGLA